MSAYNHQPFAIIDASVIWAANHGVLVHTQEKDTRTTNNAPLLLPELIREPETYAGGCADSFVAVVAVLAAAVET
ncbi:hypothetical protein FisN_7Lu385 [Fistulifera solaris]|uniref:Uncharacterized protein n=1 Tax=Fistulifera solaris TaxID=1519565 RepID=A0A1Z5JBZ1_FISSO|nr:hypothetical protein FisN_7Lu385 [Fistulifera solaris]|eukprot:GAX11281.1 hypothetical protein FisN_7Lu385 [Fistulifera solaris]